APASPGTPRDSGSGSDPLARAAERVGGEDLLCLRSAVRSFRSGPHSASPLPKPGEGRRNEEAEAGRSKARSGRLIWLRCLGAVLPPRPLPLRGRGGRRQNGRVLAAAGWERGGVGRGHVEPHLCGTGRLV